MARCALPEMIDSTVVEHDRMELFDWLRVYRTGHVAAAKVLDAAVAGGQLALVTS